MAPSRRSDIAALVGRRELALAASCLVAIGLFSITAPAFGTPDNMLTILRNSVELLLVGLGMTLLMAMGAIDVSVGVVLGLAAIGVGQVLAAGAPPLAAAVAGPAAGAGLGVVTACVVVLGRIPPIVATLGLFGVFRTAIFVLLGGRWLSGLPTGLTDLLRREVAGLPVTAWIVGAVYLLAWAALRWTPYGPRLLAIGNSEDKARLSDIAIIRWRFATFVISGALCGLAATFYVATYRNVEMTIGSTLALEAIAAVVLGGTALTGGRCSLLGTVLGVILLRIIQNGLLLSGVPSLWQTVVTGGLLLAVVSLEVVTGNTRLSRLVRRPA